MITQEVLEPYYGESGAGTMYRIFLKSQHAHNMATRHARAIGMHRGRCHGRRLRYWLNVMTKWDNKARKVQTDANTRNHTA